ncbi:protein FAM107B-like [Sinocyclocheilus anshuiensis]|uniref:protein FAM107B-like n=1 Tax=Sinocyclocheilus anshuiensis TaxID=1608454 RepID=UPI0007BA1DED|nr:PREDICTED: protein FAM107B-like [Sinocyclocheilus anshuiensis]
MRSAAAKTLPTGPSEQELKNALSNSLAGHNHVSNSSRPAQSRAKMSTDTFNCSSLHHPGDNRDKCDIAEGPWNLNNPVKASRSHQELHKELLLAHKKRDTGLVVCCKPELQMVLEKRKTEQTQREEGEQSRGPLEQVLLERQSKHQEMMKEKEEEQRLCEEVQLLEFVRVRQNLRKVHTALQKNLHS